MNVSLRMLEACGYGKIHEAYLGSEKAEEVIDNQLKEWCVISSAIKMPAFSVSNHKSLLMKVDKTICGGMQSILNELPSFDSYDDTFSRNVKRSFARLWRAVWENYAQAVDLPASQLEAYIDVGLKVPFIYAAVVQGDKEAMALIEDCVDIGDVSDLILESTEFLAFMNSVVCWFAYIKCFDNIDLRSLLYWLLIVDNSTFTMLLSSGEVGAFNDYCSEHLKQF